ILELNDEIGALDELIATLVHEINPRLLDRCGIGIDIAGQFVSAGDNPGRMRSEAGFAMLCGVAPLPASSGQTTRHRFNRGGERGANSALHMATVSRMRLDPRTRAYVARRRAEGCRNERSSVASSGTLHGKSSSSCARNARDLTDMRASAAVHVRGLPRAL